MMGLMLHAKGQHLIEKSQYKGIVWRLTDGEVMDVRNFCNDFIHLGHNIGVFLYDDLLSIMSICYQTIHILQIWDARTFVDVQAI